MHAGGEVGIADVTALVSIVLNRVGTENVAADGEVSIADMTSLVNLILSAE